MPVSARQQQVLNLALPAAWDYIFQAMHSILDEYPIDYIKWDHNRDLLDAASTASGQAAVHENTSAVYRLMEALKEHHPGLEIESCASGGARVDLAVLDRTDRIWTSDCIDPLERLDNQAYTGLLVPYELMGAHIGGPTRTPRGAATALTSVLPPRSLATMASNGTSRTSRRRNWRRCAAGWTSTRPTGPSSTPAAACIRITQTPPWTCGA